MSVEDDNQRRMLESLFERFEADWSSGQVPDLRKYVNAVRSDSRTQALIELVLIDMERRWKTLADQSFDFSDASRVPRQPLVEHYLELCPELGDASSVDLKLIETEWRVRHKWGDEPTQEEYQRRFPNRANELAALLPSVLVGINKERTVKFDERRANASTGNLGSTANRHVEHSLADTFLMLVEGRQLGPYRLMKKLGQGGCGVVFLAIETIEPVDDLPPERRATTLERKVALKVIRPDRIADDKLRARFQQEVKAIMPLSHRHVVKAWKAGVEEGLAYLAMEYIDGESLDTVLEQGRLSIANAAEAARQIAEGLQHVFEHGRTHRDLKPSNVLLSRTGEIKIVDLGLAGLKELEDEKERLTSIHDLIGTPDFMSPEQWNNARHATIASDIYSLGCTLYALLAKNPPFGAFKFHLKMKAHLEAPPPDVLKVRSDVPTELAEIIKKCLAKSPSDRFQTPTELATALLPYCQGAALAELVTEARTIIVKPAHDDATNDARSPQVVINSDPIVLKSPQGQHVPTEPADHFTATYLVHRDELEQTHPETSIKLGTARSRSTAAAGGGSSSKQSQSSRTGYSSLTGVVVRRRDVAEAKHKHLTPHAADAEYHIDKPIGEGGMGLITRARQSSIDRDVAVKTIKGQAAQSQEARDRFLSEAVVTGALEHPNVVPIYDLGANSRDEIFYVMKEVRGTEWAKQMASNTESQNLDILLRVADAIAFAHAKGIVHRDLKPANVMLGEFGEVLVMDWGLALPLTHFGKDVVAVTDSPAGTPNYMAPEMVNGPSSAIGPASDIYLLGAILFRFLTGKPPHTGKNAYDCMMAAGANQIVETDRDDELMTIALKAMATNPADRYATVKEFQQAIADYRTHLESLALSKRAEDLFAAAKRTGEYREYQAAALSFEEAIRFWSGNESAKSHLGQVRLAFAQAAFERSDFDLAASQLDASVAEHAPLLGQIRTAQAEAATRAERLRRTRRLAMGLAAAIGFVILTASGLLYVSWRQEQQAHAEALKRFRQSQVAIERLTGIADEIEYLPRMAKVRINLLTMVRQYYEELLDQRPHDAETILERAGAGLRLGEILAKLGEHTEAIQRFEWVEHEVQALTVKASGQTRQQAAQLAGMSLILQARSQRLLSKFDIAVDCVERASAMFDNLSPLMRHQLRAMSNVELAEVRESKGDLAGADELLKMVSDDYRSAALLVDASGSEHDRIQASIAQTHVRRGRVLARSDREQAESELRSGIKIWEKLHFDHADHPQYLDGLAAANIELANLLRLTSPLAVPAYYDGIKAYESLVAARPEIPLYAFNLAIAEIDLAFVLQSLGEGGAEVGSLAVPQLIKLAREYPEEVEYLSAAAVGDTIVAASLRDSGHLDDAEQRLGPARQLHQLCVAEVPDVPVYRERLATTLGAIGQLKVEQGDLEAAREHFEKALTILTDLMKSDETVLSYRESAASFHLQLADLLWKRSNETVARPHYEEAIKLRSKLPDSPSNAFQLAWLLTQCEAAEFQDLPRAAEILRKIDYIAARPGPAVLLAYVEARQGNVAAAKQALTKVPKSNLDAGDVDWVRALIEKPTDPQAAANFFAAGDAKWKQANGSHARLRRLRTQIEAAIK